MRGSSSLLSQAELGFTVTRGASVSTEILLVLPLWGVSVLGFAAPESGMRPFRLASPKASNTKPTSPGRSSGGCKVVVHSRLLAGGWLIWEGREVVGFHRSMQVIELASGIIKIRVWVLPNAQAFSTSSWTESSMSARSFSEQR